MGSTYFYIEVCTTVFWAFFVWTLLRILFNHILETPSVTPTLNPTAMLSPLPTISGWPLLNYMYTTSPYIYVDNALCHRTIFSTTAVIMEQLLASYPLKPIYTSFRSTLVKYCVLLSFSVPTYCYTCLEWMFWINSHYMGLEQKDLDVVVSAETRNTRVTQKWDNNL